MNSLSIDYFFNRIYDVLLWIKYVWVFVIFRKNPDTYLEEHKNFSWDGLRDRGWFDTYLESKKNTVPQSNADMTLWQKVLEGMGFNLKDTDRDGIPDVSDPSPFDANNLSGAELKERYQFDYTFSDKVRDFFGVKPKDFDMDGVPDSYENAHEMNIENPDSDRDGLLDGQELVLGANPLNRDTDNDGVIDGRDEAPIDYNISSLTKDTDGDGISDKGESLLGTKLNEKDTDGDGVLDGIDAFPLDSNNISQIESFDFSKHTFGLHISIQNPVFIFLSDIVSIIAIFLIAIFVYVFMSWLVVFIKSLNDYEKHFEHGDNKGDSFHKIKHEEKGGESSSTGIHNLPIKEETPAEPPTISDFEDHPRFAIIQGYMSSNSEALWRIGIMEADNMLSEVLREKGYQGEGIGEMLKSANFNTISLAWDAHLVRNKIAHEGSDFVLTEREAKRVFNLFESVFKDLKAIH